MSLTVFLTDRCGAIQHIDYLENAALAKRFESMRASLSWRGRGGEEVLLFHGTQPVNLDSIMRNNFDPCLHQRSVYGPGTYMSKYPNVALAYGTGLVLCRVLLGNEQTSCNATLKFE